MRTAHENKWLEMQKSILHAAVSLHCQQPHNETVNEISALEASEGSSPTHAQNTSDDGR